MLKYRLSVCKGLDCREGGSDQVFAAVKETVAQHGLSARCQLLRGGCYGLCHLGPNLVLREDRGAPLDPLSRENFQLMGWEGEFHYAAMTPAKGVRVVEEHVGRGQPVGEYLGPPEADDGLEHER